MIRHSFNTFVTIVWYISQTCQEIIVNDIPIHFVQMVADSIDKNPTENTTSKNPNEKSILKRTPVPNVKKGPFLAFFMHEFGRMLSRIFGRKFMSIELPPENR